MKKKYLHILSRLPFISAIKSGFYNCKFRRKTMIAFLCVSLIPLLILGSFCFFETRNLLRLQAQKSLEASLKQAALSIDSELEACDQVGRALCYDKDLATAANTLYVTPYSMFEQLNYTIDETFITAINLKSGIEGVTLYTGSNLPRHGKTVAPVSEAVSQPWYPLTDQLVKAIWYPAGDSFLYIQPILYTQLPQPKENLIVMQVSAETILAPLHTLTQQDTGILIADSDGGIIYTSTPAGFDASAVTSGWKTEKAGAEKTEDGGLITYNLRSQNRNLTLMETTLPAAGWTLLLYVPDAQVGRQAGLISLTVCIMILLCFLLVYLASRLFSHLIVRRIESLRENMETVAGGRLEVTVTSDSTDEIGEMIHDFDSMVFKIKDLIHDNYESEIKRRQSEMKALQAQINPHFLYNSLSLINWRAIRIHASDISEMAQLLSSFYRTTLNKGGNTIPVSDELLNVKSYTKIQLIMHSDSFDVEYGTDASLNTCTMPNLMLQPLMENAIVHGIENMEEGRGLIRLTCLKDGSDILFTVSDNGAGIPEELLPGLLLQKSNGYGIRNVHERAKLMYGDGYGLTVTSVCGKGTEVFLRIPAVYNPGPG